MATVVEQPSKEAVRAWLADRREAGTPPPTPQEIRRELGWAMINVKFIGKYGIDR